MIQQLDIISISDSDMKFKMKRLLAALVLGTDAIHLRKPVGEGSRLVEEEFPNIGCKLTEPLRSKTFQHTNPITVEPSRNYLIACRPYNDTTSVHVKKNTYSALHCIQL